MSKKSIAWLFDIDGVITNPNTKQLEKTEISDFIVKRLSTGDSVALVTGRALKWVENRVLPHILIKTDDKSAILNNFFVSGEFGGSFIFWEENLPQHKTDNKIKVPLKIEIEVKKLASLYTSTHFIDEDKQTMISLEMKDGLKVEEFKPFQIELAQKLEGLMDKLDPAGQFEVHIDRIATNIRDKEANKHYATNQIVGWLNKRHILPDRFICFGDSLSDIEMPDVLAKQNFDTKFIFVGGSENLNTTNSNFPIEFTRNHCDEGVVEFINEYDE